MGPLLDGAASAQASVEAGGAADLDPRRPTAAAVVVPVSSSPFFELNPVQDSLHRFLAIDRRVLFSAVSQEGQGYVDSLLRVSLQLLRKGLPYEIRRQGLKLMLVIIPSLRFPTSSILG